MARICTICAHPACDSIDAALVSGEPMNVIAERYGVGPDAVRRHRQRHLSEALIAMQSAEQAERRATLLDRVEGLIERAETLYAAASQEGKSAQALSVLKELRELVRLLGQATGELDERPQVTVNVLSSPEILAALNVVYSELADHPELRQRIALRLQPERLQLEAPR
jgi:phosphoenolpyruvate carboxylase